MSDNSKSEVAESCLEYLLAEILALDPQMKPNQSEEGEQHSIFQDRLEQLGYDVGYRYIEKLSQNKPLVSDPLEVVKFVCKDFWEEVFKKKIDKLQTNHRGVFVLTDQNFKWLERYATDDMASKTAAARLLFFPCGILKGALANLGLSSIVTAYFNTLPSCTFNIKIKG